MRSKPKQVKLIEYEIFVPLVSNTGKRFGAEPLKLIKQKIIDFFGGLTETQFRNRGSWKVGGHVVQDQIAIWRVLSTKGSAGNRFVTDIKVELETFLNQDKILVLRKVVSGL